LGEYNYPSFPVAMIDIPLQTPEQTAQYLRERITLHLEAEKLADNDLPLCTPEETWEKPTTYAIKKKDRQSALRVYPTLEEAKKHMSAGLTLEIRRGGRNRCARYCSVSKFCNQFATYKKSLKV
jgi:hypothetical protein